jgi:phospholipase/lecithinase/hemolysin
MEKNGNLRPVKTMFGLILCWLSLGYVFNSARAGFTSMYVFGDGVSTMTNNPYSNGTNYYGLRRTNGRTWVEVLAQRQGLTLETNKNWSFYGNYSQVLLTNLNSFTTPTNAATSLFVVWVNNADFVDFIQRLTPYSSNNLAAWTNAMNQSLSNHVSIIQKLYTKGARTLVMPNAVDLTKVPFYAALANTNKTFIRQRIMDYNAAFTTRLNQAQAPFANLVISAPDFYSLLDDFVAHASSYGLTNALDDFGNSIDALTALTNPALNGPGANYIFWDYLDPTARASAAVADVAQQALAPVRIDGLTPAGVTNQLSLANVPIGLGGFADVSTNLVNWTPAQSFSSTSLVQTVTVPSAGDAASYRLRFPFAWSWP